MISKHFWQFVKKYNWAIKSCTEFFYGSSLIAFDHWKLHEKILCTAWEDTLHSMRRYSAQHEKILCTAWEDTLHSTRRYSAQHEKILCTAREDTLHSTRRYSAQHEKIKLEIISNYDSPSAAIQTHLKGIVHPKLKICWTCTQAIQDVNEFVSSALDRLLTNVKKSMSWCERTTWNWLFHTRKVLLWTEATDCT